MIMTLRDTSEAICIKLSWEGSSRGLYGIGPRSVTSVRSWQKNVVQRYSKQLLGSALSMPSPGEGGLICSPLGKGCSRAPAVTESIRGVRCDKLEGREEAEGDDSRD